MVSDDRRLQHRRLRQFLVLMLPIALAFSGIYAVVAAVRKSAMLAGAAADVLGYAATVWAALQLSRRGELQRAAQTAGYGLLGMTFVGIFVVPFVFPLLVLIPLAAVLLVLPCLSGSPLRRYLTVGFAVELMAVVCNALGFPHHEVPVWLQRLVVDASVTCAVGLIFLLLWQDSRRLAQSIEVGSQSERARRRMGERLRQLTLATAQIVWTTSAKGEVVEDSPTWRAFTGQTYEQYTGLGWLESVHPDDRGQARDVWAEAVRNASAYAVEYRLRRADGRYAYMLVHGVPVLDEAGALREWVGTNTDVTARREAQEERERLLAAEQDARRVADFERERAEDASRLKDDFLATVSHELRTPLTAMLGWLHVLRTKLLTPERRIQALETVERNARAQAQLIEDLLDVSRIVAGKLRLDVAPVELQVLVSAAIESVTPSAEAKGVRLLRELGPTPPVVGDASRLQQVAWNLLANAVKFTPSGGEVHVSVRQVEGVAELVVRDTGLGIAPDFLPHIFDRFRQAENVQTRVRGGLGLGLSIVRHLVELHGGTIEANSDGEGKGAVFTVRVPPPVTRGSSDHREDKDSSPGQKLPVTDGTNA